MTANAGKLEEVLPIVEGRICRYKTVERKVEGSEPV